MLNFTMFIFSLIPYAPLLALPSLIINYLIDKYTLLRKCKRPDFLNGELALKLVYYFFFGWINYILGNIIFTMNFDLYESFSIFKICLIVFIALFGISIENIFNKNAVDKYYEKKSTNPRYYEESTRKARKTINTAIYKT